MNLVADEGVDRPVVERLRQDGHDVVYVAEQSPSTPDEEVLQQANARSAVLVTADKDFGELCTSPESKPAEPARGGLDRQSDRSRGLVVAAYVLCCRRQSARSSPSLTQTPRNPAVQRPGRSRCLSRQAEASTLPSPWL